MNAETLSDRVCVPCRGDSPRLDRNEVKVYLPQVPEWAINDDVTRLSRTFRFEDFPQAQAFANEVAQLAETQFHHPEITFGWGYCCVMFQTRKIRGLHENDFVMAAKVDALHATVR